MLYRLIVAGTLALASVSPALAETIAGEAEVVDSDILQIGDYQVYLLGVESVEEGQTCLIDGDPWECWPAAVRALQTIAEQGPVTCEVISGPNFLDQVIAQCFVNDEDIGEAFVRSGFGLAIPAETTIYDAVEDEAEASGVGLWQGQFYDPAAWREQARIFADRPTFRPNAPED